MTVDDAARLVVTGLGCVSGFGIGVTPLWDGVSRGESAIRPQRLTFDDLEIARPGADVPNFVEDEHISRQGRLLWDRYAQYAVVAAREAVADAGLGPRFAVPERVAVVVGTGAGGERAREEVSIRLYHTRKRVLPTTVPKLSPQTTAGALSTEFGVTGPSFVVSTGCAAGAHAVGLAMLLLRQGMADCAIAGGADASLVYGTVKAFDALHVLAPDTCRPFSQGRTGMVIGEGAGMVVIERLSAARRRGARIYAELCGIGMTADAVDVVHPTAHGPVRAMRLALEDGKIALERVGYVNAHGTGTEVNDAVESAAIREVFEGRAGVPPVSSTKGAHGHALGGAGGIELVVTVKALQHELIPPTLNYTGRDDACPLDYVTAGARPATVDVALSNSFAFGGVNAVLAVARAS
jgi:nodulation protein E